ncbi:MAG: ribonuclease HII [Deltaproteobacteria bacterium]|nr:ribonuclease HII [Deltaproteobacteria bacterium]
MTDLLAYERAYWQRGLHYIAGVDEVGRGCLAGPVVAAAVILPIECTISGVRDSKALSAAARRIADTAIRQLALAIGIAAVAPPIIDAINIRQASLQAMADAIAALSLRPQQLLIDGRDAVAVALPQQRIIGGDARSLSIAAASIVAKVYRDHLMTELEAEYPDFSFGVHKGYPTPQHIAELSQHGPTAIHRRSFGPVKQRFYKCVSA